MLLGIDIGSSGVKAALVDPDEGVLAIAQEEVPLLSPRPGWAEADPDDWWRAVCSLVPRLLEETGRTSQDIEAVASAGMVPAVLALDSAGRPLRRAILQNDARATEELDELSALLADIDLLQLTGSALTQQSVAPTLRWLARHEPDVFGSTASVAGSYDWLAPRSRSATASGAKLGDRERAVRAWRRASGRGPGAGRDLRRVAGRRPATRARWWERSARRPGRLPGCENGPRSSSGGADHVTSAYGAGLLEDGDWLVKLGGAGDILVVSGSPLVDSRLYLDAHPAGGWLPNGCMATSGSLIRWLAAVSGGASLDELDAEAAATPPGAGGVICLPYFLGEKSPLHDPAQRGAFVGLHLGHERGHLHRAALEAVAYGFRHHMDVFAERGDPPDWGESDAMEAADRRCGNRSSPTCLTFSSGPCSIIPAPRSAPRWPPGWALGAVEGWESIRPLVRLADPIEPRPELRARYDELYAVYRSAEPALRPISHRLAAGDWS